VVVNGTPRLALTLGTDSIYADYAKGNGAAHTFTYTVKAGDQDSDGIAIGSLDLNGATVKDLLGNNANVTLNGVSGAGGVHVDTAAPKVTSVNVPAADTYAIGENLDVTLTFDESVVVTGTASTLALKVGGQTVQAAFQSASANAVTYRYTVQAGDLDTDGIDIGVITLGTSTIVDGAGNGADLTLPVNDASKVLVDGLAPTASLERSISAVDANANGFYGAGDTLTLTFSEPVQVGSIAVADLLVNNSGTFGTGAGLAPVDPVGGTASAFTLTLGNGATLAPGGTITVPAARTLDAAGNPALQDVAFTVPALPPAVVSIAPDPLSGATAESVDYTVVFSAPVTGVTPDDFTVTGGGGALGTVTAVSGSGTTYTVKVATQANTVGTLRLDLNSSGTGIEDSNDLAIVGRIHKRDHPRGRPCCSSGSFDHRHQRRYGRGRWDYERCYTDDLGHSRGECDR
jgi:hypothetical protein